MIAQLQPQTDTQTDTQTDDTQTDTQIIYPDSDGQPIADNTIQFRWLTVIQYNLAWLFADRPDVFFAGDLLWYPVEGNNKLRQAPDVMVVFGVEKKDRESKKPIAFNLRAVEKEYIPNIYNQSTDERELCKIHSCKMGLTNSGASS